MHATSPLDRAWIYFGYWRNSLVPEIRCPLDESRLPIDCKQKFVLFTKGTAGDIAPFLSLGRELRRRGHLVTLVTHSVYGAAASSLGIGFRALDTEQESRAFLQDVPLLHVPLQIPEFFRRNVFPTIERENKILCEEKLDAIAVIARHSSGPGEWLSDADCKVPFFRVYTNPMQVETVAFLEALLSGPMAVEIGIARKKIGLDPIRNWIDCVAEGLLSIGGWPEWFYPESVEKGVIPVGFLAANVPYANDKKANVNHHNEHGAAGNSGELVVIAGSSARLELGRKFYSVAIEGCAAVHDDVLVLSRHQELLPDPLPGQVRHADYFPLSQILPWAKLIVHEGGMGTLSQAALIGIPQLILAHGADRPDNARRLQHAGIGEGLLLPDWHATEVVASSDRLLGKSLIRARCHDLAHSALHVPPALRACNLIEERLGLVVENRHRGR